MSIVERSASPPAPVAGSNPPGDRLSVITAGRVGNMEAVLGASGFDVVAVAESEDALIDAVSTDEPDAIVVEADLCASLEHVRELAPDAVLIAVGDHTPAGALGRIEQGVSGTVMAGLLHALVAEGAGAAVAWGLVPAFRPQGALQVPQRMIGSLLAKTDLVRAMNALRDNAELVTAAGTALVIASASLLLTLGPARTQERTERVPFPAPAVEPAPPHPNVASSPSTQTPAHGPSSTEEEPADRRPNRGESRQGPHVGEDAGEQGGDADTQGEGGDHQGEDGNDQGEDGNDQGKNGDAGDDQGGGSGNDQGENENARDDQGGGSGNDQGGGSGDDQGGGSGDDQGDGGDA